MKKIFTAIGFVMCVSWLAECVEKSIDRHIQKRVREILGDDVAIVHLDTGAAANLEDSFFN